MRNVGVDGDFVAGEVMIDEEAEPLVDGQFLHQRRARAHRHRADNLAARGLGVEDAPGSADREHTAHPYLARHRVHPDFAEMRAEGRLLICLGEVAIFHHILGDEVAVGRGLGERDALSPGADLAVFEDRGRGVETELFGDRRAQLCACGIDTGGRTVRTPLAARARRDWKGRIAEANLDTVERDTDHLGGGLRDDRVAAGSDVGHVGFDSYRPIAVEADACRGFFVEIVAERRGDAHADEPAPVARRAGFRLAAVPAEFLGAEFEALVEAALRKAPLGFFGIDLRVVEHAERDRIEAELFRHFVDRDFQRHQSGRFAGRAHRIAFGKVERREAHRGHPIRRGIEEARLRDGGFGAAALEVARPAFVADRGELAVGRRAEADALNRRGAVGGVIGHERPRQRDLHRTTGGFGAERGEQRVGADEQFSAEAATDIGRDQPDILLGNAQRLRHVADRPGDHLVRRP